MNLRWMDMITPAPFHIQIGLFQAILKFWDIQWILDFEEFSLEWINLEDMRDNKSQKMP